jgi:hypothetical protein
VPRDNPRLAFPTHGTEGPRSVGAFLFGSLRGAAESPERETGIYALGSQGKRLAAAIASGAAPRFASCGRTSESVDAVSGGLDPVIAK